MEAQLDQLLSERRGDCRLAIDPLQGQLADAPGADRLREGVQGLAERSRAERHETAAPALDVQHRLVLDHHNVSSGHPGGTAVLPLAFGPRQRCAVGLRRVGGSDHQGALSSTTARIRAALSVGPSERRSAGAQTLNRAWQCELRAAHALDEVAPAAYTQSLQL